MTDEEIIKALECLIGEPKLCRECPYDGTEHYPFCREHCAKDALDLIKRQQAEIERYKKLEEQGRLIELPCKDGAMVYWITTHGILERYVAITEPIHSKIVELRPLGIDDEVYPYDVPTFFNQFGKVVFLTKEEAEAKLKEMKGE